MEHQEHKVAHEEDRKNVAASSISNLHLQLLEAAFDGNVKILRNMIESNPVRLSDIISLKYCTTPLHQAVERGHVEFSRVVLEHCPEFVGELDSEKRTSLHLAVASGQCDIMRLLLSYGRPEICFIRDNFGRMPIHLASMGGQHWVLHELLHHNHFYHYGAISEGHCVDLLYKTVNGDSPIHLCIRYNKLKALELLVDYCLRYKCDAVLKCKNNEGHTPLQLAQILKRDKIERYLLHPRAQTINERSGENRWYRRTVFRLFDYDEEWTKELGEKVQVMANIAVGACITVLVCLLGFKDAESVDERIHANRRYLLNDISVCWVLSLLMISVHLVSGTRLWRYKFCQAMMQVCMGVVTVFMGFSLLEILTLASKSYETSWDVSVYWDVWWVWVVAASLVLGLRYMRFFMELME